MREEPGKTGPLKQALEFQKMSAAKQISDFGLIHLHDILNKSGYVLYSDSYSLQDSPIYLLGHNPGGSPQDQATATIKVSLEALPTKTLNNYLDESWETASGRSWSKGQAPLQRRVVWLLQQLGLPPRAVPASNLIFVRSVDASGISFFDLAQKCWDVHEKILDIVKPKLLLVFGNYDPSPYTFLLEKFGAHHEKFEESGHGKWKCRSFKANEKLTIVGLPHLSRYNIIGKHNVVNWIMDIAKL